MCLPLIEICGTDWASGEAEPLAMVSSQGKLIPSEAASARKPATVLSDRMHVSLQGSGIDCPRVWAAPQRGWLDIFLAFDLADPC